MIGAVYLSVLLIGFVCVSVWLQSSIPVAPASFLALLLGPFIKDLYEAFENYMQSAP